MIIAVEGPIGVGKTTFAKNLSKILNCHFIEEDFRLNPFLQKFYNNIKVYGFEAELNFLLIHYHQAMEISRKIYNENNIIIDFTLDKDLIFSKMNVIKNDFKAIERLYKYCNSKIPCPDIIIKLDASSGVLLSRIKKRGRKEELNIQKDYIDTLRSAYLNYIFPSKKIFNINTEFIDVRDHGSCLKIAREIFDR